MFRKHFKVLYYEKIYFYSCLITFISLFLPWFRALHVFVPGIILPLGVLTLIVLSISTIIFFRVKRRKKVLSISSIIIGFLCLLSSVGHLIGYRPAVDIGGGLYGFSIGVYVGMFGSLGIITSGILGLKYKKKTE